MVFSKRHLIYGKNGAIKYITHLDKFSYSPKQYNFREIMLYSQYPSENFKVEICVLSNSLKIFSRDDRFKKLLLRIQGPISHYTGQPKCPIGNGSNSNYHKFSTSNIIFTKIFFKFPIILM